MSVTADEARAMTARVDVNDVDGFDDTDLDKTEASPASDPPVEDKAAPPVEDKATSSAEDKAAPSAEDKAAPSAEDKATPSAEDKAAAPAGEAKDDASTQMLPRSRYNFQRQKRQEAEQAAEELGERNKALEARIKEIEGAQTAAAETASAQRTEEIDNLEAQSGTLIDEIEALRLDGKAQEAAAKQKELRALDRQISDLQKAPVESVDADAIRRSAVLQMREEMALENVIDRVERQFPQLKEGADGYDADVVEEVMDVYDAFLAKGGMSFADAMERAVGLVVGNTAPASPSPAGERKAQAVQRNLKDAKRMPPDMSTEGHDSDKGGPKKTLDFASMSIEEFEALGDEDKYLV